MSVQRTTADPVAATWASRTGVRSSTWLVLVIAVTALAAACGNGARNAAAAPATTAASRGNPMLAYSQCMRAHGIRNFPDPSGSGGQFSVNPAAAGVDTSSAQYGAAQRSCQPRMFAGNGGSAHPPSGSQVLAYASCMRQHGLPGFADPTVSGGRMHFQPPAGVKLTSPQFQNAERACSAKLRTGGASGS